MSDLKQTYQRILVNGPSNVLHYQSDNNVYYPLNNCYKDVIFPNNRTLATWQAFSGVDLNSTIADPLFEDQNAALNGNNFAVLPGSPLIARNFKIPNVSQIGLQKFPSSVRNQFTYSKCKELFANTQIHEDFEYYAMNESVYRLNYYPGAAPNFVINTNVVR